MAGPLAGIRVIDLTSVISGPIATQVLADQGADVIKVEAPGGGDFVRHVATRRNGYSASFVNNNRNKRSIIIDLKQPEGLGIVEDLVRSADVLVQNFRPGVADRIGVGAQKLLALNPRLIHMSICGFGFIGPYAGKPVFDPLIQALSGLTTVQGGSDETRPRLVRTIVPDKLTGIQAAQAISAALFARERSGAGQAIELSMLDTIVAFLWSSDMGGHTFVGDELETEAAQSFIDLIYETSNGYVTIAVLQDKHWQALGRAIDRPDFLEDARFTTAELREVNKDERTRLIQSAVASWSTESLLSALEQADVPCAPVLKRKEMIRHPQVEANGIVFESDHPEAGRLRQAKQPARFHGTELEYRAGAPGYGQHTREVLREAGMEENHIERLETLGVVVQRTLDE